MGRLPQSYAILKSPNGCGFPSPQPFPASGRGGAASASSASRKYRGDRETLTQDDTAQCALRHGRAMAAATPSPACLREKVARSAG